MSYGTPTPNTTSSSYQLLVDHDNGTQFDVRLQHGPGPTVAELDVAVQALLDLLAASPDFAVVIAEKSYPTIEEITPTP